MLLSHFMLAPIVRGYQGCYNGNKFMDKSSAAPKNTPPIIRDGKTPAESAQVMRRNFLVYAANMSWQLAIVVVLPIAGGAMLDKHNGSGRMWLFMGLGLAAVLATGVMWRTVQLANRLPVPKLTTAQKRAIRKSYEEDDNDE